MAKTRPTEMKLPGESRRTPLPLLVQCSTTRNYQVRHVLAPAAPPSRQKSPDEHITTTIQRRVAERLG